ncbi:hypothetical protein M0813_18449 [Anaeramoeba flamelloides]|uniref:AB hydrolase-1 domain-containing protein n=1 Tax=Anaeramoeba flamelloides TaxID=1746091 RepID=A0ABQ8YTT5_9EUKA|nr:hypothetical protein M0813_18449 [Anaeramoeba flamelloides]
MSNKFLVTILILLLLLIGYYYFAKFLHTTLPFNKNRKVIKTKKGKLISYCVYGTKLTTFSKVIVHYHGTPGSGSLFTNYLNKQFENKEMLVIIPERSGFGKSDFQKNRTLLDTGKDLVAILNAQNLPEGCELILSGHSSGAVHALSASTFNKQFPCKLTRIILISPAATHLSAKHLMKPKYKGKEYLIYANLRQEKPLMIKFLVDHPWLILILFRFIAPFFVFQTYKFTRMLLQNEPSLLKRASDPKELKQLAHNIIVDSLSHGVDPLWKDGYLFTQKWPFDPLTQLPNVPINLYAGDLDCDAGVEMAKHLQSLIPKSSLDILTDETHHSIFLFRFPELLD